MRVHATRAESVYIYIVTVSVVHPSIFLPLLGTSSPLDFSRCRLRSWSFFSPGVEVQIKVTFYPAKKRNKIYIVPLSFRWYPINRFQMRDRKRRELSGRSDIGVNIVPVSGRQISSVQSSQTTGLHIVVLCSRALHRSVLLLRRPTKLLQQCYVCWTSTERQHLHRWLPESWIPAEWVVGGLITSYLPRCSSPA